jgi:hypothetical protein
VAITQPVRLRRGLIHDGEHAGDRAANSPGRTHSPSATMSGAPFEYVTTERAFVAPNVPLCAHLPRRSPRACAHVCAHLQRRRSRSLRPRTSSTSRAASALRCLTARSLTAASRRRQCARLRSPRALWAERRAAASPEEPRGGRGGIGSGQVDDRQVQQCVLPSLRPLPHR